jgi:cytidylate kinase
MKTKWVITIGREFCSGGGDTAHKLSQLLDIPYYDKAIIDEAVEDTRLSTEIVTRHDERPVAYGDIGGYQYGGLWYSDDPSLMLPLGMRIADAQFEVIRRAASRGPCVVVGRCADYALEEQDNVLNVFIRADLSKRIEKAMRLFNLSESEAKKLIRKTDKIRSSYYRYYTQRIWGDAANYDLVIDAGKLGVDRTAQLIADLATQWQP